MSPFARISWLLALSRRVPSGRSGSSAWMNWSRIDQPLTGAWMKSSRGWAGAHGRLQSTGSAGTPARASVADLLVRRGDPVLELRRMRSAGSKRRPGGRGYGEWRHPHGEAFVPGPGKTRDRRQFRRLEAMAQAVAFFSTVQGIPCRSVSGSQTRSVVVRSRRLPGGLPFIAGHVQVE